MSEQVSTVPPALPSTKPKDRWRWLKIIVGICVALFLAVSLLGISNSPKLELRRIGAYLADDGKMIEITNVGTKPVTITKVTINDRSDCSVQTLAQVFDSTGRMASGAKPDAKNDQFSSSTFKVGDKVSYASSCRVIRATVDTDQGTGTYSFQ
jgi:hypothetical protein